MQQATAVSRRSSEPAKNTRLSAALPTAIQVATATLEEASGGQGGQLNQNPQQQPLEATKGNDGSLAAAIEGTLLAPTKDEVNVSAARGALSKDAETIFKEVVGDGAGMTKELLGKAAEKTAIGMSAGELEQLFHELDVDGDGVIPLEEFKDGLNATPSVGGWEIMKSLLLAPHVKLVDTLVALLLEKMHERVGESRSAHAKKHAEADVLRDVEAVDLQAAFELARPTLWRCSAPS